MLKLGYCENEINTIGIHLMSHVSPSRQVQHPREDPGWGQPTFKRPPHVVASSSPCLSVLSSLAEAEALYCSVNSIIAELL